MAEEILVIERHVDVRRGKRRAARVLFDAAFAVEMRHGEPTAGQLLGVRQRADDRVLDAASGQRIDEVAAVLELALEVLPVVGDAECAVATAQRGAQRRGIAQIAFDQLAAEIGDFSRRR
jgi:hypothetical protein